jgi:hypothetical protein
MRELIKKLPSTVNSFNINGVAVSDLREVEKYMGANNLTTLAGSESGSSIESTDFTTDAQRITEDLFSSYDDSNGLTIFDDTDIDDTITSQTASGGKGLVPS